MRTVLPGKPQAKLQAVSTAQWDGLRLVVYISGSSFVVLTGPHQLLQTIHQDDESPLDAVSIDKSTGKIVTCSAEKVTVYKPYGKEERLLKWAYQSSFKLADAHEGPLTLSWGSEEELLLGSSSLWLHRTAEANALIWNYKLPKPVKIAEFSYDASLVASTGRIDRLVKLWRRQSFGSGDTRFDFTYLPHPTAVNAVHWRRPKEHDHTNDNVLFTICADSKIRIWAATDPHSLQTLRLWAEIDMRESIKPRDLRLSLESKERYAYVIDSKDFAKATERIAATTANESQEGSHALEHLLEVAKANLEVCVVLDRQGNMSAWGLESVGCKSRKNTDIFNIAHVEGIQFPFLQAKSPDNNMTFLNFCDMDSAMPFTLLVHHFDGRIFWLESNAEELFDPSQRQERVRMQSIWTGHSSPITSMVRSASGKTLMTYSDDDEGVIWKQVRDESSFKLIRSSSLIAQNSLYRWCLLDQSDIVISVYDCSISVWVVRSPSAEMVASCQCKLRGNPVSLFLLPNQDLALGSFLVASITSSMQIFAWQVDVPLSSCGDFDESFTPEITEICVSRLPSPEDLAFVFPVDSVEPRPVVSATANTLTDEVVVSCTENGILELWKAVMDVKTRKVDWSIISRIETDIQNPALASSTSLGKVAIIDHTRTELTIWDSRTAQLELDARYEVPETVQNIIWSATTDGHSILTLQFLYKVFVIGQMRYDHSGATPAWTTIMEIDTRDLTSYPISHSAWLSHGELVIGTGNQLYIYTLDIEISNDIVTDLAIPLKENQTLKALSLIKYMNSPLPVFHPNFLALSMLSGKFSVAQNIILNFHKTLKFAVSGDGLDLFLHMKVDELYTEPKSISDGTGTKSRSTYAHEGDDAEIETLTEEVAVSLNDNIRNLDIPQLSSQEQRRLMHFIQNAVVSEKQSKSIDVNGVRFLLFSQWHLMEDDHGPIESHATTWREFVWAYHSGSQDILVDLTSRKYQGRMLWEDAKKSGTFMWMTDLTALQAQFELIARNEYTKTDDKNPINCSLYYLALKKKNVLLGLWRMAAWNREQSGTQKLLRNDFSEPRWRTAALKNAYTLLSKRRYEYAAAFFLLAGNLQDAVNVCIHQLQDLQLGIAIARVYDGDESPVLRKLLEENVLPQAAYDGDRWLASWTFSMLGRHDMAIRALITPVYKLVDPTKPPSRQSRSFLNHEPCLIVLYKHLREKSPPKFRGGASGISLKEEWDFVIQTARTYDRMGCGLLALDLLRNWKFMEQAKGMARNRVHTVEVPKMQRRRSSIDSRSQKFPTDDNVQVAKKQAPTVFEEPSSNSLLDSFGF